MLDDHTLCALATHSLTSPLAVLLALRRVLPPLLLLLLLLSIVVAHRPSRCVILCAQGNRGYEADFQIIDETAFVAEKLITHCVLPVALNQHVTTLFASTPGPPESWFMQAIRLVREDTGQPLIPIKRPYEPCDYHARTATPWVCMCRFDQRATWKNAERERLLAPLWFARQDVLAAENLGIQIASSNIAFHPDSVERFRRRVVPPLTSNPPYVYITMDPAEGGKDEFAIVALCDIGGAAMVVSRGRSGQSPLRPLQPQGTRVCELGA